MKKLVVAAAILYSFALGALYAEPVVKVYKSPTCGCCKKWVKHLEQNGFKVKAYDVQNVASYKNKYGVTPQLASCHTAIVGDYVVEGHVPASDIRYILKNKPKIKGLAVPGMPAGSPGMEQGNRKDHYSVISFDDKGNTKVFSRY